MGGCFAIVVAAGRGTRLGGDVPKQYREIGGRSLLARSAGAFVTHAEIDGVRVVIHDDDLDRYHRATRRVDLLPPVSGGRTRQESVLFGLRSLRDFQPDTVLIHDAARPFVSTATISAVVAGLDEFPGAIAAVPVVDTLKRERDGAIADTVDRSALWRAQTPQGFHYEAILRAHEAAAGQDLTDDAAVAECAGLAVTLIESVDDNFKVTTDDDLDRAARMISGSMEIRTGMGFDVHRFGPGDRIWLCGVEIPHDQGLVGHSDADAGLHALTDALLGAIGAGDIGAHFPPSDEKWANAPSSIFLQHAGELVRRRGGHILNLDLTLICEAPRIRPHADAMAARVGEILSLAADRISVKATTTERLGFTGRGEGLAAQAIATVALGG
ncbi:MAG: bifunctional 2-C-methyl-D-erythritol 4-phosphate cytidylyltransferase/2-C-methyl-D-erythritol 2,4-cyclodiphosphate synthase [Alphaproteobacteria bacterium]|nr:bifunctional 2-C-methyl-D-erythritol 4-phosphate cytidylyltransferase/2-C-methyl-D-erythritol 2,4-cyclodiphosphate synthase [Alphaproteobacteria bacterium]